MLSPAELASVVDGAPDPVVVLDDRGVIVWANQVSHRDFASPEHGLVGRQAIELIHPDDQEQAITAIGATAEIARSGTATAALSPALYRLRRVDGEFETYEVAGRPHVALRDGQLMVLVLRDTGRQQRLTRAIERIAEGASLTDVVRELLAGLEYREPTRTAGISWDEAGARRVVTRWLPAELTWTEERTDPWFLAVADARPVTSRTDQLRSPLREAATRAGLAACVAVPVPDPSSVRPACLVLWADHEAVVESLQVRAQRQANSLLRLALAQRHERARLVRAATRDALTDVINRRELLERLESLRAAGTPTALLFCDLDGFKPINDGYGHEVGDRVLRIAAQRIRGAVRPEDIVSRVGGDEFAIAVPDVCDPEALDALAARVIGAMTNPVAASAGAGQIQAFLGISIGIAVPDPPRPLDPDTLLRVADEAMYAAKRIGGNRSERIAITGPTPSEVGDVGEVADDQPGRG